MLGSAEPKTLVVDLDGTLILTDLLYESMIQAIVKKPWIVIFIPFWLISGKALLKQKLAEYADLDIDGLPYNEALIDFLEKQKNMGREIVLCTGSWFSYAEKILDKFDFLSETSGTTEGVNLTGENKASYLVNKYGVRGFVYAGNEKNDLKIWKYSENAVVVSNSERLIGKVRLLCEVEKIISVPRINYRTITKCIRIHQWMKNLLVLVPLAASHQLNNVDLLLNGLMAFFSFSFCASATYIINDFADLPQDRRHPLKRGRPLASGALKISAGVGIGFILLTLSIILCLFLPSGFIFVLLLYTFITLSYSFLFKRLQTLDVVVLAGLYTLRIFAGGAATDIHPSFWLLTFAMFLFFSLALIKRISEIQKSGQRYLPTEKIPGRGYYGVDMHVLLNLATSSGMLAVFVFSMYINSADVVQLYANPVVLWMVCPVFGYWIVRMLIMASRGEIDEDPVVFALKDSRSWVSGLLICGIMVIASLWS